MRRGSKITLPYTLCLFSAVSAVVLFAGGAIGLLAYRDSEQARPTQAQRLLSQALDEADFRLSMQFGPALDYLRQSQQWIVRGELRRDSLPRWSNLLLGPIAGHDNIRAIVVYSEDGEVWWATRREKGWVGGWRNHADIEQRRDDAHWDIKGSPATGDSEATPLDAARYASALMACTPGLNDVADGIYIHAPSQVAIDQPVLLAMDTGTALGVRGIVALEINYPAISREEMGDLAPISVQPDPDGRRLAQLKRSQTLSLLTTQAVLDRSNLALRTLFPVRDGDEVDRWYAARAYPVTPDFNWWNVASVSQASLPAPPLPLQRYAIAGLIAGLSAALLVAIVLGWRISAPLAGIARRARSVQAIDEHYLPWPRSRFTEVNALTSALEELYENAVEHLDYHDAPLVVWAQQEALSGPDGIMDAQPLKRHVNLRNGTEERDTAPDEKPGAVINVAGENAAPPAAQLQVIHGSRRELRRLQGQLAGVVEELRTAGTHFQQGEVRSKRQRAALRQLDKQLQKETGVAQTALTIIRDALGASEISLWRTDATAAGAFSLRASTDPSLDRTPLVGGIVLRSLLQEELVVSTRDLQADPRLVELARHPHWQQRRCALALAPLRFRNSLLGFILVEKNEIGAFWRGEEEAFLSSAAIQCTMVLGTKHRGNRAPVVPPAPFKNGNGHHHGNGNGKANGANKPVPVKEEYDTIRWETDLAGCIRALEGDVSAIYGYSIQALIGQPVTFLSSLAQGEQDLAQLRNVLAGVPCVGYETTHRTADGSRIALQVRAQAQQDAAGRVVGVRGTASVSVVPTH